MLDRQETEEQMPVLQVQQVHGHGHEEGGRAGGEAEGEQQQEWWGGGGR